MTLVEKVLNRPAKYGSLAEALLLAYMCNTGMDTPHGYYCNINQSKLVDILGVSRKSIGVYIAELEKNGFITVTTKYVQIHEERV